ncbi:hypothetical protein E1B28_008058 [Marasmius oreades]|uniref:Uncharacterized protein n=1 Tax=Marasmius oreades TaxID=181124 RepID=A0A9P7S3K0_9AGAR|nr:uncharacterized protein E1B28_008058 [Marasmius oreades]KAG7094462.1 hypothetical protein E1B28_008058 [Marasmius oreades]
MEHMASMQSVGGNKGNTPKFLQPQDTIKRRSNLLTVTVQDIRRHLGLNGPEDDQEWNRIQLVRACFEGALQLEKSSGLEGGETKNCDD